MEYIITWLISIETLAKNLYNEAIKYFSDEDLLINFLKELVKDEVLHKKLLDNALPLINDIKITSSDIILDEQTKNNIEKPLFESINKINEKTLTLDEFYSLMINAEYSEWNTIFIYMLQSLALTAKQFQYAASVIQIHENKFESYFSETYKNENLLNIIHNFPTIWKKKILIVDDLEENIGLLSRIFKNEFQIDAAFNGKVALEKALKSYYDIILSDIQMPIMNGIELYNELINSDKHIEKHFIFMTGDETNLANLPKNINYILKPYNISELKNKVNNLLKLL